MNINIFKEAFIVGIIVVIIGSIVGYGFKYFFSSDLPDVCKDWNKNYAMEICLFITGFIIHLIGGFIEKKHFYCCNQTLDCESYFNKN